jgi:hypothetical protein
MHKLIISVISVASVIVLGMFAYMGRATRLSGGECAMVHSRRIHGMDDHQPEANWNGRKLRQAVLSVLGFRQLPSTAGRS